MALSRGDINLEDAIDIREIKNLKLANQLLKLKRTNKEQREEKMAMQKQAMIAEQQLRSQEMAAQVSMQKIQMETQSKIQIKQAEVAFDIDKMKQEAMLKSSLMDKEFNYSQQLARINAEALGYRETTKEQSKDKRISIQNTQQSKLIEQRKNNLPSINFESNEDSLDGFSFQEFSPR